MSQTGNIIESLHRTTIVEQIYFQLSSSAALSNFVIMKQFIYHDYVWS